MIIKGNVRAIMSYGNGGKSHKPGIFTEGETEHFELVAIAGSIDGPPYMFYLCVKPHYDKAMRLGVVGLREAEEILSKFERLWPCHFLYKEWHQ